ncbi:MAG: metallophosphoesterase, partial [Tepidisphaeraceae bacterium]
MPTLGAVVVFLIIVLTLPLANLLWWWRMHRRARLLPGRRAWRVGLAMFCGFQAVAFVLLMGSRWVGARMALPAPLLATFMVWNLLVLPVTWGVLLLIDAVRGGVWATRWARGKPVSNDEPRASLLAVSQSDAPAPDALRAAKPQANSGAVLSREAVPSVSRRQLLGAAAIAIPPLVTFAAVGRGWSQLDRFRIRPFDIVLRDLPSALDGMTIAQVSDVHVGRWTRAGQLGAIVEATNRLRTDLVLLTGDLIDYTLADLPAGLDMVKRLDPRSGLAMCEGNHDLFDGREEFDRRVKASGVPLLVDETMTVKVRGQEVQVLGLQWGPRRAGGTRVIDSSMDVLLRQRREGAFPILLAHHPHAFDRAAKEGIPLTLSGHTHGGQLMLTEELGPGPIMYRYWSGLY